jgi:hypothetical protein
MLNKPSETSYHAATLSAPKPGDFPIGSAQSRAAARFLAGRRKAALIPVLCIQITNTVDIASDNEGAEQCTTNAGGASNPPSLCVELDPLAMGNTPVHLMTRQELEAKQREYDEHIAEWQVQSDTHRAAATSPGAPSVQQQEQIAVDARRELEMKPNASTDIHHDDDEAAREARLKAYMAYRPRPLVRPRPRRFRWPPSAFGE